MRARGKNFTEADRDAIRLLLSQGYTVRRIANVMNRGKSGVHTQIQRMKDNGSIAQEVFDLGQINEHK